MDTKFRPLAPAERDSLGDALRRNATDGAALRMDPLTTGWTPGAGEVSDAEVINSIKSVPCHY